MRKGNKPFGYSLSIVFKLSILFSFFVLDIPGMHTGQKGKQGITAQT
jgi:hypothetical protein